MNLDHPYFLVTINSLVLLAYFASWLLARYGGITKVTHVRLWNVLLLFAIFSTGISGVILALQVNLKLDMPLASKLLTWHVNFGISLFILSLIHFSRHLGYYRKLLSKPVSREVHPPEKAQPAEYPDNKKIPSAYLLPFALGFTSMAMQIILLRESMSLFYGNEMVIGLVLSVWMLLTGFGARIGKIVGRLPSLPFILNLLVLLSILPLFILYGADSLKNIIFPTGSMIGMVPVLIFCTVLLSPFCFLSGFLFTRITLLINAQDSDKAPVKAYAFESLGSMAGGLLLNLVLVFLLRPFESLMVTFLLVSALGIYLSLKSGFKTQSGILATLSILTTALFLVVKPDISTRRALFPGQEISDYTDTPLGSLVVTRSAEQNNFFVNSSLLFTTNDATAAEESVHYAMLQRNRIKQVLLVEGGMSGSIREILKYPDVSVDYVEVNPWILELGRKYSRDIENDRVTIFREDIRQFLRKTSNTYDIVLLQVPEPSTLLSNGYYTLEFFKVLKHQMRRDAVCSLALMPSPNYMGREARDVQSMMYSTLAQVFRYIEVVPGEKNYFLASDTPLNIGIAALSGSKAVNTQYVNSYYLDDDNLSQRNMEIMQLIKGKTSINHDFQPGIYFNQMKYWLSYNGQNLNLLFILLSLLLLAFILKADFIQSGIMVTGFSVSSLEILLLYIFQVLIGNLFYMTGVMIVIFMGGLFLGSQSGSWFRLRMTYRSLGMMQSAIAVLTLLTFGFVVLAEMFLIPQPLVYLAVISLILASSIWAGLQYRISSSLSIESPEKISGNLYSADLLGSAIGTLLASCWLTPILGIKGTLLLIMGFNLLTSAWIFFRGNRFQLE